MTTMRTVLQAAHRRLRKDEQGISLIELMITIMILAIVLAAIQRFLFTGFTTFMFGQDTFEAQAKVELAQKYLDRTLRETREVLAADPKGTYVAVITDADNNGTDELLEYYVDYTDGKLKAYTDQDGTYDPTYPYDFANPSGDAELVMTEIITDIADKDVDTNPEYQTYHLSPDNSDSGRPFIFFGDNPRYALGWDTGNSEWSEPIRGIRTFFYVDVSPTSGPSAYSLQTYIQFRNLD